MSQPSTPAGFSPAVSLATDTVIHTDNAGLIEGDITIRRGAEEIPAYRAAPASGTQHPVILVVQEIFGVHEHIRDVARRLAKLGYLAIAPELYFRQGDPSKIASIDELREKIVSKVPDEQVLADLDATVTWAAANGGDVDRLGITGFCWGGRITWLYTAHQPRVKAAVAWYGKLVGPQSALQPRHPIDVAAQLKAPVLGLYGGQDAGIPLDTVEALRNALTAADSASRIHVYPEAPHAFYADYRPSFRKFEAEDGWLLLQGWFKEHGL
ncbi:dienelactone hydrolase family protein [Uliginosibacterium sp. H3]|uniref:Dienelactone hydrolase family protein n=1 Tax=Uliginosibacterium silvisoli TaxID=3114758 RepID=A0ABU6K715_9RHOO|nr:dienelactone hydrolase family protein [Uliginosibacterium sp. H3]